MHHGGWVWALLPHIFSGVTRLLELPTIKFDIAVDTPVKLELIFYVTEE